MDKFEKLNIDLVEELKKKEDYWNNTIKDLSCRLTCSAKETVDLSAEVLSQKQILIEDIKVITYELYNFMPIIKKYKKDKIEFYLTKYPVKTQSQDKIKLLESDLAFLDQRKDIYDNHINFLRDSLKNMEQINYSIKNKITLYELTGLD